MGSFRRTAGFTIVELLVVVTIIAVLLSLMAPAMDNAIYRAELTVCAARLKAHANAAIDYAMNHRRAYLHRPGIASGLKAMRPDWLAYNNDSPADDDRPGLRPYMAINKLMRCPFVHEIDFDNAEGKSGATTAVLLSTSYSYYYGYRYTNGGAGMTKIGNPLRWSESAGNDPVYEFDVLVADTDMGDWGNSYSQAAHPDKADFFSLVKIEQFYPPNRAEEFYTYWGRWLTAPNRGPIDRSFAFEDISVQKLEDLKLNNDPRVTPIGGYNTITSSANYKSWLPP